MKTLATAALLLVLALASCGDDDSDKKSSKQKPDDSALFTAQELKPEVESDIVRRAKREDKRAGNDPANYTYKAKCIASSKTKLACRLDLTDEAGKKVNTVAYSAYVDPNTGRFGYDVKSNQDTRKPAAP